MARSFDEIFAFAKYELIDAKAPILRGGGELGRVEA